MANQRKFNMEMGAYIRNKRRSERDKPEVTIRVKKPQPQAEEVPEFAPGTVHVEYEQPGFFRRLFAVKRREMIEEQSEDLSAEEMAKLRAMEGDVEAIEEEMTEMEQMEDELEQKREGLVEKMMRAMGFGGPKYEEIQDFEEEAVESQLMDADFKQVLKITHAWLEKLPANHKKDFKESDDFKQYINVLQRYGLIRVKKTKIEEK